MKNLILIFLLVFISPFSFARMMGKDRGGGNGSVAEFVQIMDLSLDLLLEASDVPSIDGAHDIRSLKETLNNMELQPLSDWKELSYFEKVHVGFEQIFLYLNFNSFNAKTNALILAVYLEELTTHTLEDVFICSNSTKIKNSDGSPVLESFTLSLPPHKAQEFRSSQGLKKSTIAYTTAALMDSISMSFPSDLLVKGPNRYVLVISDEEIAPSEMYFEIVDGEIRGDISVHHKDNKTYTYPLVNCLWL